jgi:hypothetical protein
LKRLDSGFRRNDVKTENPTSKELNWLKQA